jgi:hypothetical protein
MSWRMRTIVYASGLVLAAGFFQCSSRNDQVDFSTEVKPILNKKCIACHGGVKRESDFSLLFRQDALAAAESGRHPIVPGDVHSSELIRRITSDDPEERMPYKKDPLTREEIAILTRWIEQGAQWGDHWAYLSVEQQKVPAATEWARNDIDRFIQDKLTSQSLLPSAPASAERLLRRVSLDVTGMPANESQRGSFLQSGDDAGYEVLVDSLLASRHFGERWAAMWLDLARYSDTKGYERDYIRSIWRYRDWLIDAFNRDMPYDSFLIEQLAGDLLPDPSDRQLLATAFHRNTMTNDEGGTDNEEFRTAAVIDRVNTTWEALMGTTFACVQCHSHPYDPFRHEEYYKFMAFFNNTRDEDTYDDYPVLRHLESGDEQKLEEIAGWIEQRSSAERAREARMFVKTWQPSINSIQSDHLVNAALTDTKWLIFRNKGQARLPNVNLSGRNRLVFRFAGYKAGGVWTIRADNLNGPVLAKVNVRKIDDWTIDEIAIKPMQGVHDLWFTYTNPNLKDPNETGMIFDWFYFTDDGIPWGKNISRAEYWKLLTKDVPSTPIMMENPSELHRVTQVFKRGNWLVKTDTVTAAVPKSMPPLPAGAAANRLGLAKWMTDPANPLVARTIVNRVWEQIFGVGLVETLEDFGTQGGTPTHPELLDHLSWKLVHEYDWSLKKLVREIVMSSTYRQDSKVTKEHLDKDPLNLYYARAPRVRLSAEQVRDEALAVAGLLSEKMYGPGVMPYQPDKIWLSPYNGRKWVRSEGEDQYRRAVYTYWKRTAPYPSMMTFDGSAREVCQARRIRTNTPLQALVTLNDSAYVEAAEHLALKMKKTEGDLSQQIRNGYQLAIGSVPSQAKLDVLLRLYQSTSAKPEVKAVSQQQEGNLPPRDKAMVLVANTILNLDEFITKN